MVLAGLRGLDFRLRDAGLRVDAVLRAVHRQQGWAVHRQAHPIVRAGGGEQFGAERPDMAADPSRAQGLADTGAEVERGGCVAVRPGERRPAIGGDQIDSGRQGVRQQEIGQRVAVGGLDLACLRGDRHQVPPVAPHAQVSQRAAGGFQPQFLVVVDGQPERALLQVREHRVALGVLRGGLRIAGRREGGHVQVDRAGGVCGRVGAQLVGADIQQQVQPAVFGTRGAGGRRGAGDHVHQIQRGAAGAFCGDGEASRGGDMQQGGAAAGGGQVVGIEGGGGHAGLCQRRTGDQQGGDRREQTPHVPPRDYATDILHRASGGEVGGSASAGLGPICAEPGLFARASRLAPPWYGIGAAGTLEGGHKERGRLVRLRALPPAPSSTEI